MTNTTADRHPDVALPPGATGAHWEPGSRWFEDETRDVRMIRGQERHVGRAAKVYAQAFQLSDGTHQCAVPISDELSDTLTEAPHEYVLTGRRGQPLSPSRLGQILRAAMPAGWTPHTLRHRFGTIAHQSSGDLRAVQELLGRASPVTTAIYTKVSSEAMRNAAAAARISAV
jgi:integrase